MHALVTAHSPTTNVQRHIAPAGPPPGRGGEGSVLMLPAPPPGHPGIKESDTGLGSPALWDLAADKQAMTTEEPLQVG